MKYWQINLLRSSDDTYLGTLYEGKLSNPLEWKFLMSKPNSKRWRKRQNAAMWAAIGNNRFDTSIMYLRVEPVED